MIVTGDPTQIDLPPGKNSGLLEAVAHSQRHRGDRPHRLHATPTWCATNWSRQIVDAYELRPDGRAPWLTVAQPRSRCASSRSMCRAPRAAWRAPARPKRSGPGRRGRVRRRSGRAHGRHRGQPAAHRRCADARAERDWRGKDRRPTYCRFRRAPPPHGRASPLARRHRIGATRPCSAKRRTKPRSFADHVAHLVVHGVLHLLGYDHERTPRRR